MIRFFIFHSTCSSQNVRKQELHYLNAILLIISANNVNQEPQSARKSCFLHPVLQNHRWHCGTKTTWLVAAGDGKIAVLVSRNVSRCPHKYPLVWLKLQPAVCHLHLLRQLMWYDTFGTNVNLGRISHKRSPLHPAEQQRWLSRALSFLLSCL